MCERRQTNIVVFHYSGHGRRRKAKLRKNTELRPTDGQWSDKAEGSGFDSTLMPSNTGPRPHPHLDITDNTLKNWLAASERPLHPHCRQSGFGDIKRNGRFIWQPFRSPWSLERISPGDPRYFTEKVSEILAECNEPGTSKCTVDRNTLRIARFANGNGIVKVGFFVSWSNGSHGYNYYSFAVREDVGFRSAVVNIIVRTIMVRTGP